MYYNLYLTNNISCEFNLNQSEVFEVGMFKDNERKNKSIV